MKNVYAFFKKHVRVSGKTRTSFFRVQIPIWTDTDRLPFSASYLCEKRNDESTGMHRANYPIRDYRHPATTIPVIGYGFLFPIRRPIRGDPGL